VRAGAAFGLAALLLAAAARAAEPLPVRIAWTTVPAQMSPVLFAQKALLAHDGKSYIAEPVHFAASAPLLRALAAGEIDIAALAPAMFAIAIANAGMEDLRILADGYQDGIEGHYSSPFLVAADGPIRTIEDLAGKVAAVNAVGSLGETALRRMLDRHGLQVRRDYAIVVVPYPSMGAMLADGRIDLAALVAPFAQRLEESGTARALFDMRAAIGPSQGLVIVARAGFLARNRAALDDFFEDYLRALRWFLDPNNRAAGVAAVAAFNHQPAEAFADWLFTGADYYRDRDARPNLALLQSNLDLLTAAGVVAITIDVRVYADLGFIDTAARRLR
jgi:NitT/TauT family transport system substrate-binding protein